MSIDGSFRRVEAWLSGHAPRTKGSLLPPPPRARLTALAKRLGRKLPSDLVALYSVSGGQAPGATPGIFRGYYMLAVDGVDGLEREWRAMSAAAEAGASWATPGRFPFAKDYGGSVLCVDTSEPERQPVVEIVDGEVEEIADSLAMFLGVLATDLEEGTVTIDESVEEVAGTFEVVLDAARERVAGDRVTNSVFTKLGIEATVEALEKFRSLFDKEHARFGFYVRLSAPNKDIAVDSVSLVDDRGRPLRVIHGRGSGAGSHDPYVFVTSIHAPIPAGSRLHVILKQTRRV